MSLYEIHVTVEGSDSDVFIKDCKSIGVKPVLLHLQLSKDIIGDMMTSSTIDCESSYDAVAESYRVQNELYQRGHKVIRRKIETTLDNPIVKMRQFDMLSYFETHIQIKCTDKDYDSLKSIAKIHDSHLSRNAFKMNDDGSQISMMTIRRHNITKDEFIKDANLLLDTLNFALFDAPKAISEFVLYDTNEAHDDVWLSYV